jgi:hemolysin III
MPSGEDTGPAPAEAVRLPEPADAVTEGRRERARDAVGSARQRLSDAVDTAGDRADEAYTRVRGSVDDAMDRVRDVVKPRLRGWLHAGTFPFALAAGIVLVALSPTPHARLATAIYAITAALLFGISGLYHRFTWSPLMESRLQRFDHSNIFLIIAGTYTPFAALLLHPDRARLLLLIVWSGALTGVGIRVFWVKASRWVFTPVYVALGWVAAFFLPAFFRAGGIAVLTLLVVGGLLYTVGGVIFALQRPDPSPRWFGFHEVFHAFTLAAFTLHYIAVFLVAYAAD